MDNLSKKRNFFSGNTTEKSDTKSQKHQEIYYEGQYINGQNVKEEQDEIIMRKKKTGRFSANYNKFF
jgi:hypothetical protein